jgi:hypothetical protein
VEVCVIHGEFDDKALNDREAKALKGIQSPSPPTGARTYVSHELILK